MSLLVKAKLNNSKLNNNKEVAPAYEIMSGNFFLYPAKEVHSQQVSEETS